LAIKDDPQPSFSASKQTRPPLCNNVRVQQFSFANMKSVRACFGRNAC